MDVVTSRLYLIFPENFRKFYISGKFTTLGPLYINLVGLMVIVRVSYGYEYIVLVLISFSHGYSAILAAKLMIKLDLSAYQYLKTHLFTRSFPA